MRKVYLRESRERFNLWLWMRYRKAGSLRKHTLHWQDLPRNLQNPGLRRSRAIHAVWGVEPIDDLIPRIFQGFEGGILGEVVKVPNGIADVF